MRKIIISEDVDGNWKGFMGDKEVRAGDPQTVLVMLITHD